MNRLFKTSSVIFLSFGILFLIFLFGLKIIFKNNINDDLIVIGPDNLDVISIPKDKGGLKVSNLDIEILNNKSALEKDEKLRPLPAKPELLPMEITEVENNNLKTVDNTKSIKKLSESQANDKKKSEEKKKVKKVNAQEKVIGLYRVQFGSFRDFKKAVSAKEKMNKKFKNLLSEIEIEIFTYTNSEELSFHRVWTNPLTKADGLKLCNLFKKQQVVCILQLNKQVN